MLNTRFGDSGSAPISPALPRVTFVAWFARAPTWRTFLAARILPFRSLVPVGKTAGLLPAHGSLYQMYRPNSSKVLPMSKYTRRRQLHESVEHSKSMFAKVEQELAEGHIEVEIGGISFRRLLCAYSVMLRGAWAYTLGSVRSLVRVNPAH